MVFAPTSLSGFAQPVPQEDSLEALQAERKRLERTIKRLEKRLELVNERLAALEQ
jgi:cell division protein FtsB